MTRNNIFFLAILVMTAVYQQLSLADEEQSKDGIDVEKEAMRDISLLTQKLTNVGVDSAFAGAGNSLNIEVGEDRKAAELRLGLWESPVGRYRGSLTVKAPFDSKKDSANFANLDGLNNATSVSFEFSRRWFGKLKDSKEIMVVAGKTCREHYVNANSCSYQNVMSGSKKYFDTLGKDPVENSNDKVKKNTEKKIQMEQFFECEKFDIQPPDCNAENFSHVVALKYSLEKQKIFKTRGYILPVKVEFGRKSFDYLDSVDFEDRKSRKSPFSASIGFSTLTQSRLIGGGFEYQKSYKEQSSKEICRPNIQNSEVLECRKGSIGLPVKEERNNLFFDYRYRPLGKSFAAGFKITSDVKEGGQAVELPIYFLETDKLGLNGGIKVNWDSGSKEFSASLFFGSTFKWFD